MPIARPAVALTMTVLALTAATPAQAQTADNDAIKAVIRTETEAFYGRNADAWQATYVHDSTASRTVAQSWNYSSDTGWDKFGPGTVDFIKQNPTPVQIRLQTSNYALHANGDFAWAEYDQKITGSRDSIAGYVSREQRTLVKRNGQWKIVSAVTEDSSSFRPSADAIEGRLNGTGYTLLSAKKVPDAIEVFKLNARLFPNSSNVYDSLGEAYAAAGDTKLAIENYEKSVALNPKNESGKAALAKLRGAKAP